MLIGNFEACLGAIFFSLKSHQHNLQQAALCRWVLFSLSEEMHIDNVHHCKKGSRYKMQWAMTMQYNALSHWPPKKDTESQKLYSAFQRSGVRHPDDAGNWFHSSEKDMPQIGLEVNATWAVISNYGRNRSQQKVNSVAAVEVELESWDPRDSQA